MSVMIRWLPLVLYLNSSVILRAIYRILSSSIENQPDLNRSSAPIKISAAISTLNSMIVGLVMNSTNLLGYLS